jgi:hypothetical protein
MTADGTSSISYPSTCATGSTCPIGTSAPDHGLSVSCGESTPGTCRCDYVYDNAVITNKEGSYTTSGGTMTGFSSGSTSTSSPVEYCVQGNTLFVHFTDSTSGDKITMAFEKQ